MEYSLKKIKDGLKIAIESLDRTPLVVPEGNIQPETYNEAISKILYHSGIIDKDSYNRLRGVSYDGDFDDSNEDFEGDDWDSDDEFEMSEYSEYVPDYPDAFFKSPPEATEKSEGLASPADVSDAEVVDTSKVEQKDSSISENSN